MEDEDGTCLLDVLCDPQALNDFLHGTSELENEDLLINSSPGETSLFADAPSPGSLLADDAPSQDGAPPGCVDLSFLEEALLSSPDGVGGPEVGRGGPVGAIEEEEEQEEEACDILRQSLQEADITEQTLALEAGLAPAADALSLYNPSGTLIAPQFLPKTLSSSPLQAMPRDTQAAVEPPQPSLLAVGPGCPSLKPAAPQLMGLLPGTVFPGTPPDTSISLSPAQGSGMLIQKAVPSLTGRPVMATSLRATAAPGILLARGPLPIQPKMPVSIQPRLVQISPKPSGQKTPQSLTLVQGTASPNILLSPPLGPKHPPAGPHLTKPVSLQLLNQGGSIVIQPQGLFQGHNQFLVPSQTPVTVPQPVSAARPLLTPVSQQVPSGRGGAPSSGHLVDGAQILTGPPRQLNFSPVFTTPTGQLALRQGTLLSGPLQLQSAPQAMFQMPAQMAGTYAAQGQGHGQQSAMLHGTALGGHITVINSPGMLPPDVASISIVNGPSVVQGLPFGPTAQQPVSGGGDGQQSVPQTSVLLLPEASGLEEKTVNEEQLLHIPQACPTELQPSPPVVAILQPQLDVPLHHDPVNPLPDHILPPAEGPQVLDRVSSAAPPKHDFIHHLQHGSQVQAAPVVTPSASQKEAFTPSRLTVGQAGASSMTTSTPPVMEQPGTRCSPLIGQTSRSLPPASFSSPASGQTDSLSGPGPSRAATVAHPSTPISTVPANSTLPVCVSVMPRQATPLPVPEGPQMQTESSIQHQTQVKQALVTSAESKGLPYCPPSVSPKMQGPQIQGPHSAKQHSQVSQIQTALQSGTQVTTCKDKGREEELTPAMRRHRCQQQLCRDHAAVLNPDARSPFVSLENAVTRLLPYHTCAGCLPSQSDFLTVDKQFEAVSGLLLKRTKDMLNKYRQLLLGEALQVSPSAEMVMLERLFLQAERALLGEERRKARFEPESFVVSLRKPAPGPPFLQSSSPPSPPSWALLSDRPPGLKTYPSSSRGALKLTIKHESGSRKVVHNSACDATRDGNRQLTNGGDMLSKTSLECHDPAYPQDQTQLAEGTRSHPTVEEDHRSKHSSAVTIVNTATHLQSSPGPQPAAIELPSMDPILCPPIAKRLRADPEQHQLTVSPPVEDCALNEHLQSAIDSILELQRMQGPLGLHTRPPHQPPPEDRRPSALEQAVNSILEGHR